MSEATSLREITLSILLFEEEDGWSAQILEYDIACQAKTFQALSNELERTIAGNILVTSALGLEPFAGISRAPQKFCDRWDASQIRVERPSVEAPAPFSVQRDLRIGELQPA